jgi:hypothetical protein
LSGESYNAFSRVAAFLTEAIDRFVADIEAAL